MAVAVASLCGVSAEIRLLIAEHVESLCDLVSLAHCSRGLRQVVMKSVVGWLRLLPEGIPTECYSRREVVFVREYIKGRSTVS